MSNQIEENARPGEDVFRPAETQVREIFRRKGQRGLAVCLHQIASQRPGKIWESLVQEGKRSDRSQTRVGIGIESAGNETRQRSARDISTQQAKEGTNHTKQGLH